MRPCGSIAQLLGRCTVQIHLQITVWASSHNAATARPLSVPRHIEMRESGLRGHMAGVLEFDLRTAFKFLPGGGADACLLHRHAHSTPLVTEKRFSVYH